MLTSAPLSIYSRQDVQGSSVILDLPYMFYNFC